jgi:hypothetical protein
MKLISSILVILLLVISQTSEASNRKGSHRVGGTNSHGKHSHYVGGHNTHPSHRNH